jgi:RNA polymerase sigma factor (sigma-70 family)
VPPAEAPPNHSMHALYSDHHNWLQGWLRRKLGNTFDAADLAQDTFIRVLTRELPDAIRDPRALLTSVAQGMVANFYRRRDIERAYAEALAMLPEAHAVSPETHAIMLEALVVIDRLLDGLPVLIRKAFLLSQLDGLPQAEIAERLELSVPTVKRYIAKALAQCCFASPD